MKFLVDFFPVLLFFVVYFVGQRNPAEALDIANTLLGPVVHDGVVPPAQAPILLATALAIVAITAQLLIMLALRKKIGLVHWMTFVLFLGFGGATIYFHNETFIMWKPTVLYWAFATVLSVGALMFRRNLIRAMLEPGGLVLPQPVWQRLNLAWIGFFVLMGIINIYIAYGYSRDTWVSFKTFGLTGATLVFAVAQGLFLARHMQDDSAPAKANASAAGGSTTGSSGDPT